MTDPLTLVEIGADIDWPDSAAGTEVRTRLAELPGLGHLAPVAEWWRSVRPRETLQRTRAVIIGAHPTEVTAATADDVGAGCREVVDIDAGDAALGIAIADEEIDAGADLLIVAVPGTAADAAVAVSVLTNTEPVKVLARGAAATDPEAWMNLAIAVRDTRRECMPVRAAPDQLLGRIGSPRLAVAAGFLLRAAVRRTPVLIDGPVATAAALIAYEAQPRAVRWWAAADRSTDPMHDLALTRMGQDAILGLGTGLGDGLAGLLTVPVIRAAAAFCG